MKDQYIFEILIYRIKKNDFDNKFEIEKENILKTYRENEGEDEAIKLLLQKYLWKDLGGPWQYNQTIGAIRILVDGVQIIGELWLSDKKRYTRIMGNKCIHLCGKAFEMSVFNDMTNEDIYRELRKRILNSLPKKKNLVIDTVCFENIAKYIDWKKFFTDI